MRTALVKLTVLNLPPISAAEFSENFKIKLAISPSCCTKLGVAEFCRVEFRRAAEPCGKDERVFLAPSKQRLASGAKFKLNFGGLCEISSPVSKAG